MNFKEISAAFLGVFLIGCQNPYPAQGGGEITAEPPPIPGQVSPPLVLRVPELQEIVEGTEVIIPVEARVPAGGTPIVRFKDLPQGAVYDSTKSEIKWTPGFEAANDASNSEVQTKAYVVKVSMYSSADPLMAVQKEMKLFVRDTPRAFTVVSASAPLVYEEGSLSQLITIDSVDFPNGPFTLEGVGLPIGSELRKRNTSNPREYLLNFSPDALTVIRSGYGDQTRQYVMKFIATAARGLRTEFASTLSVSDVRKQPLVSAPTQIRQGLNVSFVVSAEDLNGEKSPIVRLKSAVPFGVLQVSSLALQEEQNLLRAPNPVARFEVTWKGIPEDQIGKNFDLRFESCGGYNSATCRDFSVRVFFEQEIFSPPVVNRSQWPLGTIRYVKAKLPLEVPLAILDGDSGSSTLGKVEIRPSSSEISWSSGKLRVAPNTPGVRQFSVHAVSTKGVAVSESFVFEALPETWSDTLVLGTAPSDPSAAALLKIYSGAQFMNPEFQVADTRTMAFRKKLVVGAGALVTEAAQNEVDRISALVPTVVLQTTSVANVGKKLQDEMVALKLSLSSKVRPGTGGEPDFKDYELNPTSASGITDSKKPMRLSGTLNTDSKEIQTFYADQSGGCKDAFLLQAQKPSRLHPVAVQCQRAAGGWLLISGFEFGDLVAEKEDETLPVKWLKDWSNR